MQTKNSEDTTLKALRKTYNALINKVNNKQDGVATAAQSKKLNDTLNSIQSLEKSATDDLVLLHVYFKDLGLIKFSREERYSFIDVLGEETHLD